VRENYLPQNPHFVSTLQINIARSVSACFQRIKIAQLARWLDLSAGDIQGWAQKAGWKVEGELVVIPGNGDNDVKAGVVNEHIELSRKSVTRVESAEILMPAELAKLVSAAAF
jgi:translation initiation factor 3 subunit K